MPTEKSIKSMSMEFLVGTGPLEVIYGLKTSRVGEGHVAREESAGKHDLSAGEIVDGLGRLK